MFSCCRKTQDSQIQHMSNSQSKKRTSRLSESSGYSTGSLYETVDRRPVVRIKAKRKLITKPSESTMHPPLPHSVPSTILFQEPVYKIGNYNRGSNSSSSSSIDLLKSPVYAEAKDTGSFSVTPVYKMGNGRKSSDVGPLYAEVDIKTNSGRASYEVLISPNIPEIRPDSPQYVEMEPVNGWVKCNMHDELLYGRVIADVRNALQEHVIKFQDEQGSGLGYRFEVFKKTLHNATPVPYDRKMSYLDARRRDDAVKFRRSTNEGARLFVSPPIPVERDRTSVLNGRESNQPDQQMFFPAGFQISEI